MIRLERGPGRIGIVAAWIALAGLWAPAADETDAPVEPAIAVDRIEHQGQASIRIATPAGTWIYHEKGAGFASLIDGDGNDWISYHPKGGSDGKYRGIPNLVHPAGYFHPGRKQCQTQIIEQADDHVALESRSADGRWACRWDVLPDRAVLTVLKADGAYWFLYEGTPGGEVNGGRLDTADGFCLRADGQRTSVKSRWTGDIQGDDKVEWAAFGNTRAGRTLVMIHHTDDQAIDSYWPMQGNMTVFGFGRDGLKKFIRDDEDHPGRFTVALVESTQIDELTAAAAALAEAAPDDQAD
jgi:hypothetical protein